MQLINHNKALSLLFIALVECITAPGVALAEDIFLPIEIGPTPPHNETPQALYSNGRENESGITSRQVGDQIIFVDRFGRAQQMYCEEGLSRRTKIQANSVDVEDQYGNILLETQASGWTDRTRIQAHSANSADGSSTRTKNQATASLMTSTKLLAPETVSPRGVVSPGNSLGFSGGTTMNRGFGALPPCATSSCVSLDIGAGE